MDDATRQVDRVDRASWQAGYVQALEDVKARDVGGARGGTTTEALGWLVAQVRDPVAAAVAAWWRR